jgi:protein SCO1/2
MKQKWLRMAIALSLSVTILAAGLLWYLQRQVEPQADLYGPMPTFQLTDQDGLPFSSDQLKGRTVIFTFIYTNCPDICPLLTQHMRTVQKQLATDGLLGKDVVLVSISVDPERDTPTVLKEYAAKYGADTQTWHFLTGDLTQVREVVVKGFLTGVEADPHGGMNMGGTQDYNVAHSGKIVIVDKQGQIRAYHDSADLDIPQLLSKVKAFR